MTRTDRTAAPRGRLDGQLPVDPPVDNDAHAHPHLPKLRFDGLILPTPPRLPQGFGTSDPTSGDKEGTIDSGGSTPAPPSVPSLRSSHLNSSLRSNTSEPFGSTPPPSPPALLPVTAHSPSVPPSGHATPPDLPQSTRFLACDPSAPGPRSPASTGQDAEHSASLTGFPTHIEGGSPHYATPFSVRGDCCRYGGHWWCLRVGSGIRYDLFAC